MNAVDNFSEIKSFIEPDSVAIIGASRSEGKSGNTIVKNLLGLGFEGKLFPINPGADEILGLKTYPSIEEIERVDLAVIAVPAKAVPEVMAGCATNGVKSVVLISSGFSEEGNDELEEEIIAIARDAGIRIVGPNTTGIVNAYNNFTTTFVRLNRLRPGNASFIVQTGVFAGMMLDHIVTSQYFGISKVFGLGNKCDVDDALALEYLAEDPKTDVIGIYLEGLKDGRRFLEVSKEISKDKPIIVFKSGKTDAGARAAKSHTSSLSGSDHLFDAVCKQSGILRVNGFEEMMDFVKAFSFLPIARGDRVAIISITGAGCVIGADCVQENGLKLAELSMETMDRLGEINPEWHVLTNPIDLWPAMEVSGLEALNVAIEAVIEDDNVDALVLVVGLMAGIPILDTKRLSGINQNKPLVISAIGNKNMVEGVTEELEMNKFPVYSSIERAIRALSVVCTFERYK
ncbi:MAG: CoA-binding protein [Halobacteriota archaeon]|nr:CoA-binding protein [Halobacteriota archaeon]